MRLLSWVYKTRAGAERRCGFENALAKSEYERGYKSRLYRYTVEAGSEGTWRIARQVAKAVRS